MLKESDGKMSLQVNIDYAKKHADVIGQFGRYPHRNEVLGRKNTPEEIEYLKTADRWGQ